MKPWCSWESGVLEFMSSCAIVCMNQWVLEFAEFLGIQGTWVHGFMRHCVHESMSSWILGVLGNPVYWSYCESRSLALQSADFLEIGRQCVGAWGSSSFWSSRQASCSLRCSALSFFLLFGSLAVFLSFFFLVFLRWPYHPMVCIQLPYCTCNMYLSGHTSLIFCSSLLLYIYIYI